jgi:hypothetical protein
VAKKIVIAGQRNIGSKVPNANIFESPNSTTAFDMATFTPRLNIAVKKPLYIDGRVSKEYNMVTLEDLRYKSLQHAQESDVSSNTLKLNFDKKNLNNYAYFGSLKDLMTSSVTNIISKWVGSLFIEPYETDSEGVVSRIVNTVYEYKYNPKDNTTSFRVPAYVAINKFDLNLMEDKSCSNCGVKDLTTYYSSYVILYKNKEYPIVEFSGFTKTKATDLYFTVQGQPFVNSVLDDTVQNPIPVSFHVKPEEKEYRVFLNSLSSFERYLLSDDAETKYTAVFKIPVEDENGQIDMEDNALSWPVTDGYNIDTDTWAYSGYINNLLNIGQIYDEFKTNLLINKLTPRVIFDLDMTEDRKMEKLLKIYGRKYDEVKAFIDGLVYVNRIGYDKIETAPDVLIKNLAHTLGWEVINFTTENELFDSIFSTKATYQNKDYTPAEVDIELWRRILMNTNYFFKTKGTRQAIEAVFAMIGAPESMIEFNEHVYVAEDKVIRFEDDLDEYPIPFQGYFQELDDEENGKNVYIEDFKERGFNLNKVVDNEKVGVNENKFLINTKEVSLNLSSVKPIEYDIHKTKNSSLTLVEYLWELYSTHVSIKDNKLVYDHMTQSYPTMFEAILEYYRTTNDVMTFKKVIRYAIKFGGLWFKFIDQFIPATTIITEGGIGIRNTAFTPQKFKYRTSDDTGCVFISTQADPINYDLNIMSMEGFFSEGVNNDDDAIVMQSSTGEANSSDSTIVSNNYSYVTSQVTNEPSVSGSYSIIKVPQITTSDVVKISKNAISGSTIVPFEMGVDTKKDIVFTIDSITNVKLFGFTIHEYAPAYGYFRSEVIHGQEFKRSEISSNVIKVAIPAIALKPDTEYLVKPYFVLNEDISTKDDLLYHDSPYGIYRGFTDFYFPSIKVPNRPYVYIGAVIQRDNNVATSEKTVTENFTINDALVTKETNELRITLNNEVRENSVIVKINGETLTRGVEFTQSPIDEKVILIKNGSARNGELSVLYIVDDSNTVVYDLPNGNNVIEWDIDEKIKSGEKGYFIVDFSEDITNSFGVSEYQIRKNYTYNTTTFSEVLNTSMLRSGVVYKVRVTSNKTMQTLTGEVVISKVYSDYYKIRIP